jgi:hypothetical protein
MMSPAERKQSRRLQPRPRAKDSNTHAPDLERRSDCPDVPVRLHKASSTRGRGHHLKEMATFFLPPVALHRFFRPGIPARAAIPESAVPDSGARNSDERVSAFVPFDPRRGADLGSYRQSRRG